MSYRLWSRRHSRLFKLSIPFVLLLPLILGFLLNPPTQKAKADSVLNLQTVVRRNNSTLTSTPLDTPSPFLPDGPLMGNGTVTAALGISNLAHTATATASSTLSGAGIGTVYPINEIFNSVNERATGASNMGWVSANAPTAGSPQWYQLDFGSPQPFDALRLYGYNGSNVYFPKDFTIGVSNNGTTWSTILTQTNYPAPTKGPYLQEFSSASTSAQNVFAPQVARYVRITATSAQPDTSGTALFGIGQVEVFSESGSQSYYINRTDFWSGQHSEAIGGLTLSIPDLNGGCYQRTGCYNQLQDLWYGTVNSTLSTASSTLTVNSWVAATNNTLVLTLKNTSGTAAHTVTVSTFAGSQDNNPVTSGKGDTNHPDTLWVTRNTTDPHYSGYAAMATRVVDASYTTATQSITTPFAIATASATFTINPGQTVNIATGIEGGSIAANSSTYLSNAQNNVDAATDTSLYGSTGLDHARANWWDNYWNQGASIDLGGGPIERYWYTSLYALATCNRAGSVAAPMQCVQTVDEAHWSHQSWTADYNFEETYQGLYSSNHIPVAQPYETEIGQVVPTEKQNLVAFNKAPCPTVVALNQACPYPYAPAYNTVGGLLAGIALGPGGLLNTLYYNQTSVAAWLGMNITQHWNYTRDTTWANAPLDGKAGDTTPYQYLMDVADFYDSYLILCPDAVSPARYTCPVGDSGNTYHLFYASPEEEQTTEADSLTDLAFIRYIYPALIDMSNATGQTINPQWSKVLNNLTPFPTRVNPRSGKTDFAIAANQAPFNNNANPMNAIIPGNDVGAGSTSTEVTTAINTITDEPAWAQDNSFAWVFPAAARVNWSNGTDNTYAELIKYLNGGYLPGAMGLAPNGTVTQNGGGAETMGGVEAVNTMLLNCYDGNLRLFYSWPNSQNASFANMLAFGAFTVTSSIQSGIVQTTTITSQKGSKVQILNPWSSAITVKDMTSGGSAVTTGTTTLNNITYVTFPTTAGHTYQLTGTGHS